MKEYINACQNAHEHGIDFSECNKHNGQDLPMEPYQVNYLNEKLECIFTGRTVVSDRRQYYSNHVDIACLPKGEVT